ncbi:MAG: hypothetical protein GX548_11395 [Lentisphaerae bacterium]|nr:hypothetical protein [Lentisphaerota bacterium]
MIKRFGWTMVLAVMLAGSAEAWQPSGWVYHDYPWAYEPASGDWYWFHTGSTQWVARMDTGAWSRLPESALATGWVFYDWAFAFAQGNGAWHWVNETDVQPVVNMRTEAWSDFGELTGPADLVLIPGGDELRNGPGLWELHPDHRHVPDGADGGDEGAVGRGPCLGDHQRIHV